MQKTILFLAANPKNTSQLKLKEEVEEVKKELQRLQRHEQFVFKQQWATTLEALRHTLLDHQPHIIHFSGHGAGQDGIVLENEKGESQLVDGDTLAHFFKPFAARIDCVILNACFSALQASVIVQHIDFVIGMNQPIKDKAAIQFAIGFYDALAAGKSIVDAFDIGCASIENKGERLKPVLKQHFANPHWLMPIPKNRLFTGRQALLHELQDNLHFHQTAALSGLGGMGKTQTAAHYARLHQNEYRAVLWCLADTASSLDLGLVVIARTLDLPEKDAPEQQTIIAAVKDWLATYSHWLLILDNADEVNIVNELTELANGEQRHIMLTTRAQITKTFAQAVAIHEMARDEGIDFLLRRALDKPRDKHGKVWDSYKLPDKRDAGKLVDLLGALPLALDQAGAYIRETQCGLAGYLERYQTYGHDLLQERGTLLNEHDHPDPIAVTWLLSFEKIAADNPTAIEVLNLCAFLHPDSIPEVVFQDLDILELDKALKVILRYSFVQRNPKTELLTIHRLVQSILRHEMDEETQRDWAEKVVLTVVSVFPDPKDVSNWSSCERLLPCAKTCVELIENWNLEFEEAALLLNEIGGYLHESKADYESVKPLYERSLAIYEKVFDQKHPNITAGLNNLAVLYYNQGDYESAKPLYERSLAIFEKVHGQEHPLVATSLNNLAVFYKTQGDYKSAKPLYERSLAIREKVFGQEHPNVATSLNNLAQLYNDKGDYESAKPLYERALAIDEKIHGQEHPNVALSLNNLAQLYNDKGDYKTAKPLYERSLAILEKFHGKEHPDVATSLNNLAGLYRAQGNYDSAKPLYERTLKILNKFFKPDHPHVRICSESYARLLEKMEKQKTTTATKPKGWLRKWLGF
ncbi:FxSxx-COOH system tetratricopeptide repeat protein [Candidatus Parabeggiatoa sp. HSG14]|uniref:FxSxx-COOH system tetratricopeptide repeat protein n=1 Tax=Candidatus Parabeggiatoa sp. HSG14 TaxID=3055593 RepID=UPI0025A695E0|nr:FxSxx-COOH system tetratricopeptide repeat protein [Thiotrichales bacterium HSG14]